MGNKTPDIFPILPLASCLLLLASCLLLLASCIFKQFVCLQPRYKGYN
ncbi:MAG: hypothetical protein F6K56_15425 [Moorea sp. SIO3G5]|nr:hypothetical protein [Moorena sp. SIO3G5]